jgi:hypothetical protein
VGALYEWVRQRGVENENHDQRHIELFLPCNPRNRKPSDSLWSRVEMWRGGLGGAHRWPTLSSVGASLAWGPADGRGKAERNPI